MPDTLVALGVILGLTLTALLFLANIERKFEFWPTPGNESWQGLLFWGLFRGLNLTVLALALVCWRPWREFTDARVLGAGLAVSFFVLYGGALRSLGRANVYCGRDGLVTDGIYAWTRNPQYAAAIPAYLGLAIASGSAAVLGVTVLLMLSFALMAFAEERWLEAAYGAEYRAYKRAVPRFYNWRRAWAFLKQELLSAKRTSDEPVSERP